MPDVVEQLRAQISAGKITFQKPEFRGQLLGEGAGTHATAKLQALVLELSKLTPLIDISSVVRSSGHHGKGRAVDIGNETIAPSLLPLVVPNVSAWSIDEIIVDAGGPTLATRNQWNHDVGLPHQYDVNTLNEHGDHIHFAVLA